MTISVVLLGLAPVAVGIYAAIRHISKRGNDLKRLCEQGHAVVGEVTEARAERRSRTDENHYIRYTFKTRKDTFHERELKVTEHDFGKLKVGQDIDVVYLPDDPEISAFKSLVDQMREAMNRH